MCDIRIYISCYKPSYVPEHSLLFPIQTGSAQKDIRFENMLHDDDGENISDRNHMYCELTAQFWAWKNVDADYYGFMHNRRYLSFSDNQYPVDEAGYIPLGLIDDSALQMLGYDEENMRRIIECNDIITTVPVDFSKYVHRPVNERNVLGQYASGVQHERRDLEIAFQLIKKMYPDYVQDIERYIDSQSACLYNIYIMRKEYMMKYNQWLFSILEKLEHTLNIQNASEYAARSIGFIAERLFGIFLTHLLRVVPHLKVKYLQVGFFDSVDFPYPVPMEREGNIPIVICLSDEYAVLGMVLLQSILENSNQNDFYDFIILDNGLKASSRYQFNYFVKQYSNVNIRFIRITKAIESYKLPVTLHLTNATYGRLLILEYLRNYPKVLYLDSDIVLTTDVAALYRVDLGNMYLGAVRDTVSAGWCCIPGHDMSHYIQDLIRLKNPFDYFNGGVLLMNITLLRSAHSAQALLEMAQGRNWRWMDQDVLNYVCKGNVRFLPQEWNVMAHTGQQADDPPENYAPLWIQSAYHKAKEHPKLVHWAGHSAPCFHPEAEFSRFFWMIARRSPSYEYLFDMMVRSQIKNTLFSPRIEDQEAFIRYYKQGCMRLRRAKIKRCIRPIINFILPIGSLRRSWASTAYRSLRKKTS